MHAKGHARGMGVARLRPARTERWDVSAGSPKYRRSAPRQHQDALFQVRCSVRLLRRRSLHSCSPQLCLEPERRCRGATLGETNKPAEVLLDQRTYQYLLGLTTEPEVRDEFPLCRGAAGLVHAIKARLQCRRWHRCAQRRRQHGPMPSACRSGSLTLLLAASSGPSPPKDSFAAAQVSPDQGRFLAWLVATLGAIQAIEIGVFTGYSAVCIAKVANRLFPEASICNRAHLQAQDDAGPAGTARQRTFGGMRV